MSVFEQLFVDNNLFQGLEAHVSKSFACTIEVYVTLQFVKLIDLNSGFSRDMNHICHVPVYILPLSPHCVVS